MTKDEMKNKISMALKDPILQQGFEIICKNLLELEEENAELKAYNEKLLNGDIEKHNKIVELEKENTELKEVHESDKRSLRLIAEKGVKLENEIAILLSCKNCSENKGGYICQKEYEDKCLAQKIQYIKELKEENAGLKEENEEMKRLLARWIDDRPYTVSEQKDLISDTEQFLKECE